MSGEPSRSAQSYRDEAFRTAWELVSVLPVDPGCAIACTGSFARREMTPFSDLDLILLVPEGYDGAPANTWYPLWDSKIHLDCAVRTTAECVNALYEEPSAALALLDLVHVAGNEALTTDTRAAVRKQWLRALPQQLGRITQEANKRWLRSGSCVSMTRPDVKNGRGGLRDIELLRALALGNLSDAPHLDDQSRFLVDVRTWLHLSCRRARDILDPEFAADIADKQGFGDRYELSAAVAEAARTIDSAVTIALDQARDVLTRTPTYTRTRRPVGVNVLASDDRVCLARNTDFDDPGLPLRVGAAAARYGLKVASGIWSSLRTCPPLPEPWPRAAVEDFFTVLSAKDRTLDVVTAMDRFGLWTPLVPEWERVRGLMPLEPTHIHTIDRHLLAVVAGCASQSVSTARPDLLLLAALFHDIGKRCGRPHAEVGAEMVVTQARRMGYSRAEIELVRLVVAEHSTLVALAATRDVTQPSVVNELLDAVNYNQLALSLLAVLSVADALGTGPGVLTPALMYGMRTLVDSAESRLIHATPRPPQLSRPEVLAMIHPEDLETGAYRLSAPVDTLNDLVTILNTVTTTGLEIFSCRGTRDAVELEVRPRFGDTVDTERVAYACRAGQYRSSELPTTSAVAMQWYGSIVEIRCPDQQGLLAGLLRVLPPLEWWRAEHPGATFVGQFKLAGHPVPSVVEREVTRALVNH